MGEPDGLGPRVLEVDVSIEVEDVDAEATRQGLDVIYPLADEPRGAPLLRAHAGRTVHNLAGHLAPPQD